jgi:hypothetical protein
MFVARSRSVRGKRQDSQKIVFQVTDLKKPSEGPTGRRLGPRRAQAAASAGEGTDRTVAVCVGRQSSVDVDRQSTVVRRQRVRRAMTMADL